MHLHSLGLSSSRVFLLRARYFLLPYSNETDSNCLNTSSSMTIFLSCLLLTCLSLFWPFLVSFSKQSNLSVGTGLRFYEFQSPTLYQVRWSAKKQKTSTHCLNQGSANYHLSDTYRQLLVSVNKVLLEHRHACCVHTVNGCFHTTVTELAYKD